MANIEQEGKSIAEQLGIKYEGPQYWRDGTFAFHTFTDPVTGTTFAASTLGEAKASLIEKRKAFGVEQSGNPQGKAMLNGNIFRQAKELLQSKSILDMNGEELTTVKAAMIPLDLLPQFNDMNTLDGLEKLARVVEGTECLESKIASDGKTV